MFSLFNLFISAFCLFFRGAQSSLWSALYPRLRSLKRKAGHGLWEGCHGFFGGEGGWRERVGIETCLNARRNPMKLAL